MRHDGVHNMGVERLFSPASNAASANSQVVDLRDWESCTFAIQTGATDAVGTLKVQESDSAGSGFADAPDKVLIGGAQANLALAADDDDKVATIGYAGYKRYVRLAWTKTSGTVLLSAVAILMHPRLRPTPDQHFA